MHNGKQHNPYRLDGPDERRKDRPKGPIPGGGTNPFRTPLAHKKLKGERPNHNV